MIYKMVEGRPTEYRTSIDTTNKTFIYKEMTSFMEVEVIRVATPGDVTLFRARLADRPFTLHAETILEIAESVRYLRSLGFQFNSFTPEEL